MEINFWGIERHTFTATSLHTAIVGLSVAAQRDWSFRRAVPGPGRRRIYAFITRVLGRWEIDRIVWRGAGISFFRIPGPDTEGLVTKGLVTKGLITKGLVPKWFEVVFRSGYTVRSRFGYLAVWESWCCDNGW